MNPIWRYGRIAALTAVLLVLGVSGCSRSQADLDDRTLEKRSFIETVRPEDRKDPFRP